MDAERLILTRGLPKTGQTTSYANHDNGLYQSGWWIGQEEADNKTRFVLKTFNGDEVVIDLATGLMWAADGAEAGCGDTILLDWGDTLDAAYDLVFAGFTDWRVPNINELESLVNYSIKNPCILQPPFANTEWVEYWSSTTNFSIQTEAWATRFGDGKRSSFLKTSSAYFRSVRGGL